MKISFERPPVPQQANGLAIAYGPGKRNLSSWRWRLLVLLVASPLLLFVSRLAYNAIFVSMPGFVSIDHLIVKASRPGTLVEGPAVGALVQQGQLIVKVRNPVVEQEYNSARAGLVPQGRGENEALTGAASVREITTQQQIVALYARQYQDAKDLLADDAATRSEVDRAYGRLLEARSSLYGIQRSAIRVVALPDRAANDALRARRDDLAAQLEQMDIRSPSAGTVAQVFAKPGEWVMENAEIAEIRLNRPAKIEVYVEPSLLHEAEIGHGATISFLDGYRHRARVTEVKMVAQRLPSERANPLTVRNHSIVAVLAPETPLPARYNIDVLPVNVEFDMDAPRFNVRGWMTASR